MVPLSLNKLILVLLSLAYHIYLPIIDPIKTDMQKDIKIGLLLNILNILYTGLSPSMAIFSKIFYSAYLAVS